MTNECILCSLHQAIHMLLLLHTQEALLKKNTFMQDLFLVCHLLCGILCGIQYFASFRITTLMVYLLARWPLHRVIYQKVSSVSRKTCNVSLWFNGNEFMLSKSPLYYDKAGNSNLTNHQESTPPSQPLHRNYLQLIHMIYLPF